MSIVKEFKEFALKGNLVDMAIAFVMGTAFARVVTGFIDGLIMPVIGKMTAGVDFKTLKYILSEAQYGSGGKVLKAEAAIKYGEFITIFIDFLLVALVMFMLLKAMNRFRKKQQESQVVVSPSKEEILLSEIRDLLKNQNKTH